MHVELHEVFVYIYTKALKMFGLVSGRRVQRRYSLSKTTLQQGNFKTVVLSALCIQQIKNIMKYQLYMNGSTNE